MPAAYAKPAPIDTNYFKRHPRDVVIASLAGPAASLALASPAVSSSGPGSSGEALLVLTTFAFTNASLFVFHLLPIPASTGPLLALVLPPHAREVFRNADRYLALIVLVVLFLFTFLLGSRGSSPGRSARRSTGADCLDCSTSARSRLPERGRGAAIIAAS